MSGEEFFTFREYMRKEGDTLSASAEDYMEMIFRLSRENGFTRVNDLAEALNVQPPSVTKMIQKLAELDLLKYERYGVIMLKDRGAKIGRGLLDRHNVVEEFLRLLDIQEGLLENTEKIEHTINGDILNGMIRLVGFFKGNPSIHKKFIEYK
ncbi:MAG: metal-dependent transcriptional regulator [Anaerocolumna sp.]